MTGSFMGGPRPKPSRNLIRPRQLTIGECIAIARYGEALAEGEKVPMQQILDAIDAMEVCTTCGWTPLVHQASAEHKAVVNCCAHYSRDF